MNQVLGGRGAAGYVLGRGASGAAATWWMAGGATNCVAAYQPKGAASLAASYTNLANPGTYDAAPGVAPTWDAAGGWTFAAAASTYLRTGILASATMTAIVKLSDAINNAIINAPVLGAGLNGSGNAYQIIPVNTGNSVSVFAYGSGANTSNAKITSGVVSLAGANIYIDGSSAGTVTGTFSGTGIELYIGGHNNAGTPGRYANAKIQAVAIYSATLSAATVAAVSAAMQAL